MASVSKLSFLHCLSSLHSGTGQGIDAIDQPIARETGTTLPYFPGSSLKGRFRDEFTGDPLQAALFGPDTQNAAKHAGAVSFSDARLLLFPVRCLAQTFLYTTSPYLLRRFATYCGLCEKPPANMPKVPVVTANSALLADSAAALTWQQKPHVILEDLTLPVTCGDPHRPAPNEEAVKWANFLAGLLFPGDPAFHAPFRARFAILDDANFTHLARHATEITTHITIDDATGTVEAHKLWYQENLPAETVLFSLLTAVDSRDEKKPEKAATLLAKIGSKPALPLGGKLGTGHGLVRFLPI